MFEAIMICMGIFVVAACIIALAAGTPPGGISHSSTLPDLPDGEKYVDKNAEIPHYDGSLADKVDSRFTNIVKNPWDGIL